VKETVIFQKTKIQPHLPIIRSNSLIIQPYSLIFQSFLKNCLGLTKEQVAVELVDGRVLRVRGGEKEQDAAAKVGHEEHQEEDGSGAVRWHCRERAGTSAFETQFRLPEDAAADEMRAAMADGVFTVTVPKRKGGKKRHHGGNKPV
jgi:HSP20 family protein